MIKRMLLPALLGMLLAVTRGGLACPYCGGLQTTLCEEIDQSAASVIVKMVTSPAPDATDATPGLLNVAPSKAKFEILEIIKGEKIKTLKVGDTIEVIYFGEKPIGTQFVINGIDPPAIAWGTPIAIPADGAKYLHEAMNLPKDGTERLKFFLQYLDNQDPMLARDSYDEFGKAPYTDIKKIKASLPHDKLVSWIKDSKTSPSNKRLYLTMLSVCGSENDIPMLEAMVKSGDFKERTNLDATIGCYLTLKGVDGLPLIEDRFLKNNGSDDSDSYVDTNNAIMALRITGQEKLLPLDRLSAALRLVLDRPTLADLVIPDLARWEDWSAIDRVADLFKKADEKSAWVRVPVIQYLRACPDEKAKTYLVELKAIDPKAFKQADNFFPATTSAISALQNEAAGEGNKANEAKASGDKTSDAKASVDAGPGDKPSPAAAGKSGDANQKTSALGAPASDASANDNADASTGKALADRRPTWADRADFSKGRIVGVAIVALLVLLAVFFLLLRNPTSART